MDERSFLTGLKLGEFLHQLKGLEFRVGRLTHRVDVIETRGRRFGILAALWTFALLSNISSDKAADIVVEIAAIVLKR